MCALSALTTRLKASRFLSTAPRNALNHRHNKQYNPRIDLDAELLFKVRHHFTNFA